ncbi:hypothetical protein QFC21_003275 [Naganishia friedmannii]|uniref:Uncharacterized protein n=1 Tax=Naganishia friedmannii TaxID=89922 RepID=A0ACC2VRG8_9TREE|nr:hypothetical protein QFC21_003275 [Naganishia friedmannii]
MNARNIASKLNPQRTSCRSAARNLSTSSSSNSSIAPWIQRLTTTPPKPSIDLIDLERAQQLCRVLPTRTGQSQVLPEWGDALGKGHHLAYFWPKNENEQLGEDGSSTVSLSPRPAWGLEFPDYNAPYPYTRRMWAGGSFEWPASSGQADPGAPEGIIIGSSIREQTSVQKIEEKGGMVFVHQLKEFSLDGGGRGGSGKGRTLVKEIRMHVFRQPVSAGSAGTSSETPTKAAKKPPPVPSPPYDLSFSFTPSLPLLFRFSALTFNAHRIHYDATWARETEGHASSSPHAGPVVHGPLSALVCVEVVEQWLQMTSEGRERAKQGGGMRRFEYRATSPMFVDRRIEVFGRLLPVEGEGEAEAEAEVPRLCLWVVQDGKVGMTAAAYFH